MEDVYLPLQLSEQQIQTLASEFTEWQGRCLVRTDSAKIYVLRWAEVCSKSEHQHSTLGFTQLKAEQKAKSKNEFTLWQ